VSLKWYAIYTRPRWEKKVNGLLNQKGIESYCPLNKVRRKWSDRIKLVEEPLFKSYVFVKIDESDRTKVRMTNGVVNFVYWNGKPAIIKEREIQVIRRFLDEFENVEVTKINFEPEDRVKVISGPMMEQEGKVLEVKNKVAKVCIDSLGYMLVAYIDKSKLISAQQK
jgi:transcription antitermination factor NusG